MGTTKHEDVTTVWLADPDADENAEPDEREVTVAYEATLDDAGDVVLVRIVEMEEDDFASGRTRIVKLDELDEDTIELIGAVCKQHATNAA